MCYGWNSVLFVFPDPFTGTFLEARMCRITLVFSLDIGYYNILWAMYTYVY